jgi:hypothetical protein
MTKPMSIDPSGPTEKPTAPTVVAVVTADDPELLRPCLEAVADQVFAPSRVFVVGGDDQVRKVAADRDATWRPNLRGVYDSLGSEVTYVWFLRERSRPDPTALVNLIRDGERVDASVAGSKVVDAADREVLVSVGYATDVFDAPYSGLEPGELDQAQYDVIRDVAAVADTSMLVRRDLFRGLHGVDLRMAPVAAAIDFCQRARLRGGRIVVVPSSVVAYAGPDPAPRWRERAGEIRSMIKAYSLLTLLWALPVSLLIGLVESIARPFLGRFPLPGVLAAWGWNLYRLPSALGARWRARRGRAAGDEELFRYQTNGSVRLRSLYEDALDRLSARFPEGILSGFSEAVVTGQQRIRHPAFFVGLFVVIFALVATRDIWTAGLPVVGFSLLPPDSPTATLGAYAGGWNPAGLGSPEVLRPHVAFTALVQMLTFSRGGAAVAVIVVAAFIAGAFGMGRLLRLWGIGSISGYLAGVVLMSGAALGSVTGDSHWVAIPAMAAIPWATWAVLRPRPDSSLRRASHVAGAALAVGVAAVFVPLALFIPVVAVALWAGIGVGERGPAVVRAAAAAALAVPLLIPWVLYVDLGGLVRSGPAAFWSPPWPVVALVALALVGALASSDRTLNAVGAWGGLTAVLGTTVARSGGLGAGAEVEIAGVMLAGVGVATVVGAVFEVTARRAGRVGLPRGAAMAGTVAAGLLLASTLLVAGPGRAGLPRDTMSDRFSFAVVPDGATARVLLFGRELPGTHRDLEGLPYRVFVPPFPTSWEAYLNEPRLGDEALHGVLEDLLDGKVRRAGAALAEFGIGWVAFTESTGLEPVFEAQLDLVRLRTFTPAVFFNEVAAAPAMASDGTGWVPSGTGYRSPDGRVASEVVVASNADFRWGDGAWRQDEWRNAVGGDVTHVAFHGHAPRRIMAIVAGIWLIGLVSTGLAGREWRRQ